MTSVDAIRTVPGGVLIQVRVVPRSSSSTVEGFRDGVVRVRLHAAPVDGAANRELIETLASWLRVPKRAISIESGEQARVKRVRLNGVDAATLLAKLAQD